MIVIGLGSGRTGTASLAKLFSSQENAICFHELNPAGSVFEGNPQPALNTIQEFQRILGGGDHRRLAIDYSRAMSVSTYEQLQRMQRVDLIGDIAFYYLNYVEDILALNENVRFVCIKRDRSETIRSWEAKTAIRRWPSLWLSDRIKSLVTRTPFYTAKNHWQSHNGSTYQPDPVWDSCFPNVKAASRSEAIGLYWDQYYAKAEELQIAHSANFRIFPIAALSSPEGQKEILSFVGMPADHMVLRDEFHSHKSEA